MGGRAHLENHHTINILRAHISQYNFWIVRRGDLKKATLNILNIKNVKGVRGRGGVALVRVDICLQKMQKMGYFFANFQKFWTIFNQFAKV